MAQPPSPTWVPNPLWVPDPSSPYFWESRGEVGISVCIAFSVISLVTLVGRLFTRLRIVCNVGVDDYIIVVSWLFASTFSALVVIQVSRGLGRHAWDLTYSEYTSFAAPFWASIVFYQLSITFTKISILLQYLRIFVSTRIRRATWILIAIVVAYGLWSVISAIFMCTPVPYFWDKTLNGYCLSELPVWFSNAAMNIATDLAILTLPMPALSQLKLPKKQKIGLMLVLALGGVVCIISIVRFSSLYVISVSQDVSWDNVPIADWTAVECNIGIMCACLPTLKPLLSRFLPFLMHSGPHGSDNTNDHHTSHHPRSHAIYPSSKSKSNNGRTDRHVVLTEANGPSGFAMGRLGLFPPGKAVTKPMRSFSHDHGDGDDSPSDIEEGRIKVITVVEQEVGDESENSSQRNLVW